MGKRVYKLKPDTEDLRDKVFKSTQFKTIAVLPKLIDLRSGCSRVVDQGELGSCTANAIASGLREILGKPIWKAHLPESSMAILGRTEYRRNCQ